MSGQHARQGAPATGWVWPIDLTRYDRDPDLTRAERAALADLAGRRHAGGGGWPAPVHRALARLLVPLHAVLDHAGTGEGVRYAALGLLVDELHRAGRAYWGWGDAHWRRVLAPGDTRQPVAAVAYLLCGVTDFRPLVPAYSRSLAPRPFAAKIFGQDALDAAVRRIADELRRWGYAASTAEREVPVAVATLLLANRSPHLEDSTVATLERLLAARAAPSARAPLTLVARALAGLGLLPKPLGPRPQWFDGTPRPLGAPATLADVPAEWAGWCRRWHDTTTLAPQTRAGAYFLLLKAGRWLAATHPAVTGPAQWERALAAAYVAAVDRMRVGEWTHAPATHRQVAKLGRPLAARAKDHHLWAIRTFLRDGQEWGWCARRFDPHRALATPRAIRAQIGPAPRVIADDIWARLLQAGLDLAPADRARQRSSGAPWYPCALVRALALAWLFTGLRADELSRLRVGCIRWPDAGDAAGAGLCWLDVPAHKTGAAYTKAVDRQVGDAIAAWERERPPQPPLVDPKTGELIHFLFACRGERLSRTYLNRVLIPTLCRKAGVPEADARGTITSHRARATIASQLANGRQPMTVFELKDWLGHRHLASTLHYVRASPTRVAKAYAAAGYGERNVRLIDVLIDRDTVRSGAAASGADWKFYDQGHGYCTYDFFDQCPHRMACAKCAFYRPKGSTAAQLLEGKGNLLRLRQEVPLTDEEIAAVEEGLAAFARLLDRLADVPTPDGGPPPRLRGA